MVCPSLSRLLVLLTVPFLFARASLNVNNEGECSRKTLRREWRTLSRAERADWINAIKCLGNIRHERLSISIQGQYIPPEKERPSLYDDFAYAHATAERSAHITPYFLPWHRWVLWTFEVSLRDICGYTGTMPYWDWSQDHRDLFKAPVFDPDPLSGLGENGDCYKTETSDCNVQSGALSNASSTPLRLAWPSPHILRRNMTLLDEPDDDEPHNATIGIEFVSDAMSSSTPADYYLFQHKMTQIHNHIHNFVGADLEGECSRFVPPGTLCGSFTSNDPLFWLHHGQMDRIWHNWQMAHPRNYDAFHGFTLTPQFKAMQKGWSDYKPNASVDHMLYFDRVSAPVHVSRTFNVSAPPFCYYYDDQEPA